jgi:excisionase family DNA binding protein
MLSSDYLPVGEAARALGVNAARVRAMLASGQLAGDKVGGRWLVHAESVRRRKRERRGRGRQLSPRNAWGLLFLASGEAAPWIAGSDRAALLRLIGNRGLEGLSNRFHLRGSQHSFAAHPGVLQHIAAAPEVVLSGASAAQAVGLGLSPNREVDGYVSTEALPVVASRFALAQPDDASPNVRLRVPPEGMWPFQARHAPLAVVALDLSEDVDARSARIGLEAIRELDRRRAWVHSADDGGDRAA